MPASNFCQSGKISLDLVTLVEDVMCANGTTGGVDFVKLFYRR